MSKENNLKWDESYKAEYRLTLFVEGEVEYSHDFYFETDVEEELLVLRESIDNLAKAWIAIWPDHEATVTEVFSRNDVELLDSQEPDSDDLDA